MATNAETLVTAAHAVRDSARSHKQAESFHRRQAQQLMQRFTELTDELAKHGIAVQFTDNK